MEYFCFHRDRADSAQLRREMVEQHWSYMDDFAHRLLVRGPTFHPDGSLSGSVHVVDVETPAEARAFAFDEPGYQAGAYRDVLLRRWVNVLGRTMWQFAGPWEGDFFLVLGFIPRPVAVTAAAPTTMASVPRPQRDLVMYGPMLADDGATRLGTVGIVRAHGPDDAERLLQTERHVGVEVWPWTPGGRRAPSNARS